MMLCCVVDIFFGSENRDFTLVDKVLSYPFLKLFTFSLAFIIQNYSRRALKLSGILFMFWLLYTIFGTLQLYLIHVQDNWAKETFHSVSGFYYIFYIAVVASFLLSFFPESDFIIPDRPEEKYKLCTEEISTFPTKITFFWCVSLLRKGCKTTLNLDHLWNLYPKQALTSINGKTGGVSETVKQILKTFKNKRAPCSVFGPILKAIRSEFVFAASLKFCSDFLTFCNIFLLKNVIDAYTDGEPGTKFRIYFWTSIILLSNASNVVLKYQHEYRVQLIQIRVQSSLFSAVYRKILKMSSTAQRERTVGDIVNLMAVDVAQILNIISYVHDLWFVPVQVSTAFYFLFSTLGPTVLIGVIILVVSLVLYTVLAKIIRRVQSEQMKLKDQRIKMIYEIIAGIMMVKMSVWESGFEKIVLNIRKKETFKLKLIAFLQALSSFISLCTIFLMIFAVYWMYLSTHVPENIPATVILLVQTFLFLWDSSISFTNFITHFPQFCVSLRRVNDLLNSVNFQPCSEEHNLSIGNAIDIQNGVFSWQDSENGVTLANISLTVKEGFLVVVVGRSGSGKSSLLSAILGEMYKISGEIYAKEQKAYVPQQAWIQNRTIRDNILFGLPHNPILYHSVLLACALNQDLDLLPGGDMTEIGEQGLNLSGGQKQRVALARAVYVMLFSHPKASNSPRERHYNLCLFDDTLSALDTFVARRVYKNVMGPEGVLKDKTRIITTSPKSKTVLKDADMIVMLEDGKIIESGTFDDLWGKKRDFYKFYMEESNNRQYQLVDELISQNDSVSENHRISDNMEKCKSGSSSQSFHNTNEEDKLIQEETTEVGKVKWAVYNHYLKSGGLWFAAFVLFLVFHQLLLFVLINSPEAWITDAGTPGENNTETTKSDFSRLCAYTVIGIMFAITFFGAELTVRWALLNSSSKLHNSMLHGVLYAPLSFTDSNPCGRIIARFSRDMDILDYNLPTSFHSFLYYCFAVMMFSFAIMLEPSIFTFAAVVIVIFSILIMLCFIATSRQLRRLESVSRSPIYSHLSESFVGATSIRAYGAQDRFIQKFEENVDSNQRCNFSLSASNMWVGVWVSMCGVFIIFLVSLMGTSYIQSPNEVYYGLLYFSTVIVHYLRNSVLSAAEIETNIVAVERIKEYSEIPTEVLQLKPSHNSLRDKKENNLRKNEEPSEGDIGLSEVFIEASEDENQELLIPVGWPSQGKVEFKRYKTRYREGKPWVLDDLNFVFSPSPGYNKVGIVGRTGAGKTCLVTVLYPQGL
ncbi:multidrug resistance-associated protein 1-like isoform X2 [Homalodisca vitripennis]|uniref:multidrug resistance-associated protein 1-like isoform X2 n=1 Tax=Homalodisca vitripennis TaxID=197043 RepID=UPI001EEAB5F2|nr:multidrug resistance-associated protein 1-like isoform X2 [Homalodisca vitripennis]